MSHHNDTVSRAVEQPGSKSTANEHLHSPTHPLPQPDEFDLLQALVAELRVASRDRADDRFAILGATLLQEAHLLLIGRPGANQFAALITRCHGRVAPIDAALAAQVTQAVEERGSNE